MRGQRRNKIGYECINNSLGLKIIAGYCNRLAHVFVVICWSSLGEVFLAGEEYCKSSTTLWWGAYLANLILYGLN